MFVGHARILRHLLELHGERTKVAWARTDYYNTCIPLLHFAAGYGILSSVRLLLSAGADEVQTDPQGRTARDVVGTMDSEKYAREKILMNGDHEDSFPYNEHGAPAL